MSGFIMGWVIAAIGAGLAVFGFRGAAKARRERDQVEEAQVAIEAAAQRLQLAREAAIRAANQKPVDPKRRDDFEQQP
ncbi:MAG: hypothetical protein NHG36_19985 [Chromatiaceae bacterium]|nr:hypothetical protein [Candidatus Thioaporhodococcus sediminis]